MTNSNAVGGLKWVKGEIVASLQRVRVSLETFDETAGQGVDLSDAVTALNEIRGVLAALQLPGPARLVAEMQQLCDRLSAHAVSHRGESIEALMLALIQLPDYLDKLESGQQDAPLVLLPAINDLRGSRGARPLTEAELLVPTSVLADAEMPSPDVQKAMVRVAGKIRPHFHRYLLLWFNQAPSGDGLLNLGRLFHQLQRYIHEGIFHDLFLAAEAVTEGLRDSSIPTNAQTKALIGHLDRVLKPFAENPDVWPEEDAQALLVGLMSLIAKSDSSSYLVTELRRAYGGESRDQGGGIEPMVSTGANPETIAALIAEARKELLPVKDVIDLYARGKREDIGRLLEVEPLVRNLANTLTITGEDELVDRLRRCANAIAAMGQGSVPADDRHLMSVAEELLAIEAGLAEVGEAPREGEAQTAATRSLLASTLKEARVEMSKAEQAISALIDEPENLGPLREVPEYFGRVAGALRVLSENDAADVLSSIVEQIQQRYLMVGRAPASGDLELLAQAVSGIELYMEGLSGGELYRPDLIADVRFVLRELSAKSTPPPKGPSDAQALEPAIPERSAGAAPEEARQLQEAQPETGIDPEFLEIFLEEAQDEERSVRDQYARWSQNSSDEVAVTTLRRSFHTLKGSGRLVGADRVGAFSHAVEALLNRVIDGSIETTPEIISFVGEAVALLPDLIDAETHGRDFAVDDMVARAETLVASAPEDRVGIPPDFEPVPGGTAESPLPTGSALQAPGELRLGGSAQVEAAELEALAEADDELLDIFRAEAGEHLSVLREFLAADETTVPGNDVVRALHTLTGSARMTGVESTAAVTSVLERLFQGYSERTEGAPGEAVELLSKAVDAVQRRLEHLPAGGAEFADLRDIARDAIALREQAARAPAGAATDQEGLVSGAPPLEAPPAEPAAELPEVVSPGHIPEMASLAKPVADDIDALGEDAELLGIFLEDAHDILDKLDRSLRDLQLAPTSSGPIEEQQRLLHTLKGSARLSGFGAIGDLSHALESLLTAITNGQALVDDDNLELAQRTLDTLANQVDAAENREPLPRADDLVKALASALEGGEVGEAAEPVAATPAVEEPEPVATAEPLVAQIRVRGDVLNHLINNAGEISIYRSRLAQHSGSLGFRLDELDQTVVRLREQLRLLDIETEAQIIHRFERDADAMVPDRENFDPLELDRFSTLQQLSRSLAETVNDLVSLGTILSDLQSESDTLLLQQERIADELQDGLLRTRMVPFVQIMPRLHRVVRQTAQQLGKKARLEVYGADVELDRSIRERVVAPLEHLLRNAVSHGVEMPGERSAAGKAPEGVVALTISREGNDAVISVSDDGAGLDLDAIHRRALERGLCTEDDEVSDEEITQMILESGFTTAEVVTQISGRGVGLDVVNAEVKQLSGTFNLETRPGKGTSFTIRLPLTLAIVETLLVQVGDEVYAVPHATIEGAARVARQDLETNYKGIRQDFGFAGKDYRVMYLGSTLGTPAMPDLGERRWLPVLLARTGDQRVAFHVDTIIGSQRVVVKPLGPQLSNIRWLSGGTILPDGRVAMILDLLALIRSGAVHDYRPPLPDADAETKRNVCVMVVDDSLTVRRVTSRMLKRQGMDVITAQDGVEALTRLEERVPDLMLLDIEMPRMDGYELTRHIRRSPLFEDIPVIMITSRTGVKHRKYAMDLGVDRYLGKPYQEAELLDEISSLLVEKSP